MRETSVWSLVCEDPLEKGMATHSSILAWRIPWMEELFGLQSMGSQRVGHDWVTFISLHFSTSHTSKFYLWNILNVIKVFWKRYKSIHNYFLMFLTLNSGLGFPGGPESKESACNAGDLGLVSGLGRSPEGRHGGEHFGEESRLLSVYSWKSWRVMESGWIWVCWFLRGGVRKIL